jgi:hypothetical protein
VWCHTLIVLIPRKLRQEDSEFEAILDSRTCLKKTNKKWQEWGLAGIHSLQKPRFLLPSVASPAPDFGLARISFSLEKVLIITEISLKRSISVHQKTPLRELKSKPQPGRLSLSS